MEAKNFDFCENYIFESIKISKNSKFTFTAPRIVEIADFDTLISVPFYTESIWRAILILENFTPENYLAQFQDNFCCYPFTKNIFT